MQVTDSLLNEASGQLAIADVWAIGTNLDTLSLEGCLGQSLTSCVCGCNPYLDGLARSFNREAPMSANSSDFAVIDGFAAQGIDHGQRMFVQNYPWTQPNQIDGYRKNDFNRQIDEDALVGTWIKNALHEKYCQEQVCECGPSDVGFRAEDKAHPPIITGDLVSPKEVSND